jgi:hypothetical protein
MGIEDQAGKIDMEEIICESQQEEMLIQRLEDKANCLIGDKHE